LNQRQSLQTGDEAQPQEGHNQEAKEVIESKAQCVADLTKKEQIPTVVVYHHPHHLEKQQSSKQGHEYQHTYAPTENQKGNQSRGAWRTTSTAGRHQDRETIPWKPGMMQRKIRVARQQMDIMFDFH
jgi:hypothetical protein